MKSLSLAVLITISLLLPIIPATPLPICDPDSIDSSANYLLPKDQLLSCGLPLSRSYLLSQFNAILTVDKIPKETKFYAQSTSSITVSVCRPPESFKELFWHDDVSVISPTPWDVETCKRAELNIYTRLVSENSFQSAYVRPLNLPDRCGFRVEFTPYYSGDYKLEVVNTWLAASTDPNPESAHPEYGHRWIDGDKFQLPRALMRGSHYLMSCEDICSMTSQCQYWTSFGQGISCCHFFSGKKVPTLLRLDGSKDTKSGGPQSCKGPIMAGIRKLENFSGYLGGIVTVPPQLGKKTAITSRQISRQVCRSQAHAANSPVLLSVLPSPHSKSMNDMATAEQSLEFCSGDEVFTTGAGRWDSFDTSSCYNDTHMELEKIKILPSVVLQSAVINGIKYEMLQDKVTYSIYYKTTYLDGSSTVELSFRTPRSWFPEKALTPPWQLQPRCTLGSKAVPPNTMDMKGVLINVISFAYVRGALTGFDYISPSNCRFRHFSRGEIRNCINRKNISSILASGDSVIGGLTSVFKWMIGVNAQTTNNWYDPNRKHVVSQSNASILGNAFTFGGLKCQLRSYKRCLKDIKNIPQDKKSFVIINWNLQHLIWGQTFDKAKSWASKFYKLFKKSKAAGEIASHHTFIFMNGMALHGFREPYCTQSRSQRFSSMIEGYAAKSVGWKVLDGYNMTLLRTDMSYDGMHYNDAMNYMFAQVLINMMCE